jgi:hypothetical protein
MKIALKKVQILSNKHLMGVRELVVRVLLLVVIVAVAAGKQVVVVVVVVVVAERLEAQHGQSVKDHRKHRKHRTLLQCHHLIVKWSAQTKRFSQTDHSTGHVLFSLNRGQTWRRGI